jgi:hypothetical protein
VRKGSFNAAVTASIDADAINGSHEDRPFTSLPLLYKIRRRALSFSLPKLALSSCLPPSRSGARSVTRAFADSLDRPRPSPVSATALAHCRRRCGRKPEQRPARYRASSETCPNPVKPRRSMPVEPFAVHPRLKTTPKVDLCSKSCFKLIHEFDSYSL